jgi:phosphatidylserine/phosphatidylglycerophosphate/cardiolipin synthase-like enzyme
MHNKVLVVDDSVITGSYNFSRSAQFNAENILFIESAPLAERYSGYIDHLVRKYGDNNIAAPDAKLTRDLPIAQRSAARDDGGYNIKPQE